VAGVTTTFLPAAMSTSSAVTRLKFPVPFKALISNLYSSANFLAVGVAFMTPSPAVREEVRWREKCSECSL